MLTHPTLDQLRQLGLAGMARAFEDLQSRSGGELAPAEWLGLLLDREISDRQDRRLKGKCGDEARLPARGLSMVGLPGAGSFGPTLWSTLMTTRRVAGIAGLRF